MLNDDFYINYGLDDISDAMRVVQNEFLREVYEGLKRLSPAELANRKTVNELFYNAAVKTKANNSVVGMVDAFMGNTTRHELSITMDRLETAYKAGVLDRVPPTPTMRTVKTTQYADRLENLMLSNKASDMKLTIMANRKRILSGAKSVDEVIKEVMIKAATKPWTIPIARKDGSVSQWSADARMALELRNDVKNTSMDATNAVLGRTQINLVEVSSHGGSRPDHAEWQGEVFWLHTPDPKYRPFSVCGEGDPAGFGGVNCRHRKAPFFEGIDDPPVKDAFDHKLYEATQEQRRLEQNAKRLTQQTDILRLAGADDEKLTEQQEEAVSRAFAHAYGHGLRPRM
jgi:hypothetical protein